jgi:hypothetical protein
MLRPQNSLRIIPRYAFSSLFIQIKIFFEIIQVSLDLVNRRLALAGVFAEQILLAPTPNVQFSTVDIGFDDNLYRVLIDPILNNLGARKYSLNGIASRGKFLVPPVSVTALRTETSKRRGEENVSYNAQIVTCTIFQRIHKACS